MKLNSIKKYLYVFLGSAALFLGVIGIFIPILPTTPFLLLASFFYLRSSQRLYNWLINHKICGAYIYSYLTYKAISKKTKIGTIFFLWSTLIVSMILMSSPHIRIFLVLVGIGVTIHLLMLKTMSLEDMKSLNDLYCNKTKEQTLSNEE